MNNKKILIVDDDIEVLKSTEEILLREGYEVNTVESGEKALEFIKKDSYNLMLLDMVMEGIDGYQVLKEAKNLSPQTLIIVITGYGSIDSAVNAFKQNAFDYLLKPCDVNELKFRIQRALEWQNLEQALNDAKNFRKISEIIEEISSRLDDPLSIIMSYAELLSVDFLKEKGEDDKIEAILSGNQIKKAVEEIKKTIQRIKGETGTAIKKYGYGSQVIYTQKSRFFEKPDQKTVLVIDKDDTLLSLILYSLEKEKFKVTISNSSEDALKMIKKKNYSVIVLDADMPFLNGYELFLQIIKFYTNSKVQIPATIMTTGIDVDNILSKCKEIGAYTAIQKPFNTGELVDIVKQAEEFSSE